MPIGRISYVCCRLMDMIRAEGKIDPWRKVLSSRVMTFLSIRRNGPQFNDRPISMAMGRCWL